MLTRRATGEAEHNTFPLTYAMSTHCHRGHGVGTA